MQFLSQLSMQQAFELLPSSFKRYERDLRELSTSPFQPYVSIDFTKPCILSIQRHAFRGNVLLRRKLPSSGLFLSLFLPFNTEFFSSIRYRRRPGRNWCCIYSQELSSCSFKSSASGKYFQRRQNCWRTTSTR